MTLEVGATAPFTMKDLWDAPLGMALTSHGRTYRKTRFGFFAEGGYVLSPQAITETGTPATVTEVPDDLPRETFEQFRHRVWTSAFGFGRSNSISVDQLRTAIRGVDAWVEDYRPRPNMFVHYYHPDLMNALPNGTLLAAGDWRYPHLHRVGTVRNGTVDWLFGTLDLGLDGTGQVISYPEGTITFPWEEPREDDEERIARLRYNLWDLGVKFKADYSWCGAFENYVYRVFSGPSLLAEMSAPVATERTAPLPVIGDLVASHQQMREAPVGSILASTAGSMRWQKDAADHWTAITGSGLVGPSSAYSISTLRWESVPSVTDDSEDAGGTPGGVNVHGDLCRLSRDEIETLPDGAVVRYPDSAMDDTTISWCFIIRNRTSDMGSSHLSGPNTGEHGGYGLVWDGTGEPRIPIRSFTEMSLMPVGTVLVAGTSRIPRIKESDTMWRIIGGDNHGELSSVNGIALHDPVVDPVYVYIPPSTTSRHPTAFGTPLVLDRLADNADFERLPQGTIIQSDRDAERRYIKGADGFWTRIDHGARIQHPTTDGRFSVWWEGRIMSAPEDEF